MGRNGRPPLIVDSYSEQVAEEAERLLERLEELDAVIRAYQRDDQGWHYQWRKYLTRWISVYGLYSMPFGERSTIIPARR